MDVDWWAAIDSYCERTGPDFWSEPLNALSNLSFVVAAVVVWRMARPAADRPAQVLALGAAGIGVGSFLFHTFANVLTLEADVLPIRVFVLVFVALATTRFFNVPWWVGLIAAGLTVPFSFLVTESVGAVFGRLGGSIGYLPVPVLMLICVAALWRRSPAIARGLLLAAAGFGVSLCFRTIDLAVCSVWPLGTHFLWHLLNGAVVGWMIVVFLRARTPSYPAYPGPPV